MAPRELHPHTRGTSRPETMQPTHPGYTANSRIILHFQADEALGRSLVENVPQGLQSQDTIYLPGSIADMASQAIEQMLVEVRFHFGYVYLWSNAYTSNCTRGQRRTSAEIPLITMTGTWDHIPNSLTEIRVNILIPQGKQDCLIDSWIQYVLFPLHSTTCSSRLLSIKGGSAVERSHQFRLQDLITAGKARPGQIVTAEIDIEDAPGAYRSFSKHDVINVAIRFDKERDWQGGCQRKDRHDSDM
ncbi:hypothetical protein AJ80_06413 [Polytolypa hystricis UAMH7299]|uniref:Uncharacterized protein n=1 Tax=Polytolypa hystricis (strain UAMH7299) TaxID=1447883 RepID=A0A2B7XXF6_POLH7|nr:hypothetical protein AJ80_06413 [Polytolypa hystricis UAMH7299]